MFSPVENDVRSMSQSEVFRPSNGNLFIRSNLSDGMPNNTDVFRKRPSTQGSLPGYRFGRMSHNSFFTRHNPHPARVRHIKGLLDIPICAVNDNGYFANPRYSMNFPPNSADNNKLKSYSAFMDRMPSNSINVNSQMYPINTITGLQYFMGKPLNFKVFRERAVTKPGLGSAPDAWRDELQALIDAIGVSNSNLPKQRNNGVPRTPKTAPKTPADYVRGHSRGQKAEGNRPRTSQYSAATGRLVPPPSRAMSRQASRQGRRTATMEQLEQLTGDPDTESIVLAMLAQILQTDDISAVQSWLVSAGDREKCMVLDMIRAALASSEESIDNERREKFTLPGIEGQIIGDETSDLTKHIDRLSLMDEDPKYQRNIRSPEAPCIPEEDADIEKPSTNAVFRITKSRSSNRPKSRAMTPPNQPSTPNTELKLKYMDVKDTDIAA